MKTDRRRVAIGHDSMFEVPADFGAEITNQKATRRARRARVAFTLRGENPAERARGALVQLADGS